jgi:predicted nucleic acid-binding protein
VITAVHSNVLLDVLSADLTFGVAPREAVRRCRREGGLIACEVVRAGGSRQRLVPDFLVAAHAAAHADRLLSRDRGFFRSYFSQLVVLDPTPTLPTQRR